MIIGVPREIKQDEHRVGLIPQSVRELVMRGHHVIVEHDCGLGIGFTDQDYLDSGAQVVKSADKVYDQVEMIIKVKEPQPSEWDKLHEGQVLFTYLHLAPDPEQTKALIASKCTAIAYETVTDFRGGLPLLTPMSEVAGRMSIQAGIHCLEKHQGGSGILLGGVPGVSAAHVVIIGGGIVGTNAIRMAIGLEANVTVLDRSLQRLRELDTEFGPKLGTVYATATSIEQYVKDADLVVGAVLIPGASAPKLLGLTMLEQMHPGSVLVDVSIDQGGCFETSRVTTHSDPTYTVSNIVHYCVANIPGAVPRTAAFALNNATLPYIIALADLGYEAALTQDTNFMNGLNVHKGLITHSAVAESLGVEYIPAMEALL